MDSHFPEVQRQFMEVCKQPTFKLSDAVAAYSKGYCSNALIDQTVKLWSVLINEEVVEELFTHINALRNGHAKTESEAQALLTHIADDIVDAIYVLCGLGNAISLPITKIFAAVHVANMRKAVKDAEGNWSVLKRADGKIQKPEGWKPADIDAYITAQIENEKVATQPYTFFLHRARECLKDHEIGLLVDQRNFEEAMTRITQSATDLVRAVGAIQAYAKMKKALDAYEPEGSNPPKTN